MCVCACLIGRHFKFTVTWIFCRINSSFSLVQMILRRNVFHICRPIYRGRINKRNTKTCIMFIQSNRSIGLVLPLLSVPKNEQRFMVTQFNGNRMNWASIPCLQNFQFEIFQLCLFKRETLSIFSFEFKQTNLFFMNTKKNLWYCTD